MNCLQGKALSSFFKESRSFFVARILLNCPQTNINRHGGSFYQGEFMRSRVNRLRSRQVRVFRNHVPDWCNIRLANGLLVSIRGEDICIELERRDVPDCSGLDEVESVELSEETIQQFLRLYKLQQQSERLEKKTDRAADVAHRSARELMAEWR